MDLSSALQIAQVVAYILGAVIFIAMMKADIRIIRHDMKIIQLRQDALNEAFKQLTEVLTRVAVQDNRILRIENDIRELRHGKGYIKD